MGYQISLILRLCRSCSVLLMITSLAYYQVTAQITTSQVLLTTFQQFLYLPDIPSLSPLLATSGGFANQHITFLSADVFQTPTTTSLSTYDTFAGTYPSIGSQYTTETAVPVSDVGRIVFACNASYYTHRFWFSRLPSFDGFTDASCTVIPTSSSMWYCLTTVLSQITSPVDGSFSVSTSTVPDSVPPSTWVTLGTDLLEQEHRYTVIVGPSMLTAPGLITFPTATAQVIEKGSSTFSAAAGSRSTPSSSTPTINARRRAQTDDASSAGRLQISQIISVACAMSLLQLIGVF